MLDNFMPRPMHQDPGNSYPVVTMCAACVPPYNPTTVAWAAHAGPIHRCRVGGYTVIAHHVRPEFLALGACPSEGS